jgi:hypothetical protein
VSAPQTVPVEEEPRWGEFLPSLPDAYWRKQSPETVPLEGGGVRLPEVKVLLADDSEAICRAIRTVVKSEPRIKIGRDAHFLRNCGSRVDTSSACDPA